MNETIGPNKTKTAPRLPRGFAHGGFLSDMGHTVTISFFD
jgi:hypothetical protein